MACGGRSDKTGGGVTVFEGFSIVLYADGEMRVPDGDFFQAQKISGLKRIT